MAKIVSAETDVIENKPKVGDLIYIICDWYIIACVSDADKVQYTFVSLSNGNRYTNGEHSIEVAIKRLDEACVVYKILEKGSRITLEQK